ncbi:hypothetical protein ACWT_7909 [Actinoplanes sp. SE50]|uniref:DUF6023 family protein n=1 Tax=unclassified Actinoplanes TaxID=2626549 RepID=UPI00023EDFCA|nr:MULTISPECIES: DUF6023 family protein [unclassified Actinoplanes]AEV88918.1 hypothetical protein ACPL_8040 [Actinoplanes sp. SE50/110]ATO87324.1 hypothetical protein ACWT_7909 [Actinoplanes sp. SE50]SLM04742.1 hypothetical protein ACSP50_8050 [Actinoplanes sp. SE50/110]
MSERGRGAILHGLAALVLAAGGTWWWRAAPRDASDPRLLTWRLTAEQLLPETGDQEAAETVALAPRQDYEKVSDLDGGTFQVSVICAGPDGSRARVSFGGPESGLGLNCSGTRTPQVFSVGVGTELRLRVTAEGEGPVVFRYTLQRA